MATYITVRFGDGQEAIFNPNCRAVALLRNIRDRCLEDNIDSLYTEVDLSDESGNIKYLRDTPLRYANEVLNDRECLVLLRVNKHDGVCASYTPLLKDDAAITEDFLGKIGARLCVREEDFSDDRPESSWRAKSNTRRSPAVADKDKDGRKSKVDARSRTLKPEKQNSRSRSRQGK
ncbi:hypothetical protein ACOMHN_018751 [Nucella lapillus]